MDGEVPIRIRIKRLINMNEIFKNGDTVYHWRYGKGIIGTSYATMATVFFENHNNALYVDLMYDELSFTPYTINVNHVRPNPDIEKGQLIWVRDDLDGYWSLVPFDEWENDLDEPKVVADGLEWEYYSINNPFNTSLTCFRK